MTIVRRFPACAFGAFGAVLASLEIEPGASALELPSTGVTYRIDARLDPATRILRATEEIRWTNPTDEQIATVPLHLYLNAFSHEGTTWMREAAPSRGRFQELLAIEPDPWGYIELLSVRQGASNAATDAPWRPTRPDDGNPFDRSLAEVNLPAPVPPHGELILTVEFEARLPVPIARTGGARDFFFIAQWYPKIGVIEPQGVRHAPNVRSAARQFHGPTEFYADFADYDVTFAVPPDFLVGATGRAQGEPSPGADGLMKVRYTQKAVHDFALVVGASLRDGWARHTPKGGGPAVDVRYIVTGGYEHQIPRCRKAIEGALDVMGSRVGPYPYDTLTVVMMPFWASATGGMEYPTLITSLPGDPLWDRAPMDHFWMQENVAIHEFGHQYFYGVVASNEQEEAFLDEGFDSYWEGEVMRSVYGADASLGVVLGRRIRGEDARAFALAEVARSIREPLRKRPAWLFAEGTAGEQIYSRSAVTFATAAALFGQDKVDQVFAEYYRRFAFRHPDADDFLDVAGEVGGAGLGAFVREAFEREAIPDFKVTDVETVRFEPPLGRVVAESGPIVITPENRAAYPEVGLDPAAHEADGRILMEITDPGWARGGRGVVGSVTRAPVVPEHPAEPPSDESKRYYESTVRIEGPAWDTLPAEVEIRFEDGAVVRDQWDGKSAWRRYRFVRPSPLRDARIDPGRRISLDVTPQNNSRAIDADGCFTADWGLWLGALSQWLSGGLSLWL